MLFHTVSNQNTWTTKFVAILSLKQNLTPTLKAAVNIKKCCNAWICASVVTVIIQRFVSAKNVFCCREIPAVRALLGNEFCDSKDETSCVVHHYDFANVCFNEVHVVLRTVLLRLKHSSEGRENFANRPQDSRTAKQVSRIAFVFCRLFSSRDCFSKEFRS